MQMSVIVPTTQDDLDFVAAYAYKHSRRRHEVLAVALHAGLDLLRNGGTPAVAPVRKTPGGNAGCHASACPADC